MSVSRVECGSRNSAAVIKINTHISPMAHIRENVEEEILVYLVTTEIACWHSLPSHTGNLYAVVVFVWSESVGRRTELWFKILLLN